MSELKVNRIAKRSGNSISLSDPLRLKTYTTSERDSLTASQGDTIYNSETTKVEYYNGSQWLTTNPVLGNLEYLVIAGGGGGSTAWSSNTRFGGGGGAGGYRCSVVGERSGGNTDPEDLFVVETSTNYTVTVGAGGAGGSGGYFGDGSKGSDSVFATITSLGGGGAGDNSASINDGGSGAGTGYSESAGLGTNNQGCDGGFRINADGGTAGAGGGGAGSRGNNGGYPGFIYGGNGLSSSITGSAVTRAAGGGSAAGSAGANTGTGGGGGSSTSAGSGGSGIVILKFPDTYTLSVGVGLTYSQSTASGYTTAIFTAGTDTISFS